MSMTTQAISPLWETMPLQRAAQAPSAGKPEVGSIFADVLKSTIDNVREAEDDVAKKEYLLSTGQLDNPAELNMATYKAEAALSILTQLRERALNAYSELSRINL